MIQGQSRMVGSGEKISPISLPVIRPDSLSNRKKGTIMDRCTHLDSDRQAPWEASSGKECTSDQSIQHPALVTLHSVNTARLSVFISLYHPLISVKVIKSIKIGTSMTHIGSEKLKAI